MSIDDDVIKAVQAIHQAIRTGETMGAAAPVSDDARITCYLPSLPEFPVAGEWRGKAGLDDWIRAQAACLSYESFDVRALEAAEDAVMAIVDVTLSHRETGARYRGAVGHMIFLRDGVIEQIHAHMNSIRLEAAVREAQLKERANR